jgi:hypothetical protein
MLRAAAGVLLLVLGFLAGSCWQKAQMRAATSAAPASNVSR